MDELNDVGSSIATNPSALCSLQKMDLQLECLRDCNRALQISSTYAKVKLISFDIHILYVDNINNNEEFLVIQLFDLPLLSYYCHVMFFFFFCRHGTEEVKQMLVWKILMMLSVTFKFLSM